MTNAKHTPGMWSIGTLDGSQGLRILKTDHEDNAIGVVGFVLQRQTSRETDEEIEANARLIAAAPDLLAALEKCAAFMDDDDDYDLYKETRAAIAKAKGK